MYVTEGRSPDFDPDRIDDPTRTGGVDWSGFNDSFHRLQERPWWRVNEGRRLGLGLRALRLAAAFVTEKRDAIVDLERKARAFWSFRESGLIPENPDVVFFGAEAGWEALLLRALYGDGGRVVLIDNDPAAFRRFEAAETERRVRAPRGFPERELLVRRDRSRIEYLQADLFDVDLPAAFDVGIDWGLIEHFDDASKRRLLATMARFLRPGGVEVSSTPRNTVFVRLFYRAFRDEMNFGYRELLTLAEHRAILEAGGWVGRDAVTLPAHNIILAQPSGDRGL